MLYCITNTNTVVHIYNCMTQHLVVYVLNICWSCFLMDRRPCIVKALFVFSLVLCIHMIVAAADKGNSSAGTSQGMRLLSIPTPLWHQV